MMSHTIQNSERQKPEEQCDEEEEMLLHGMMDREQQDVTGPTRIRHAIDTDRKTPEATAANERTTQNEQNMHGVFLEQLEQLKQSVAKEPEPKDDANNSTPEEAQEFLMEGNRTTEDAETEKETTEPTEQKQGIYGFFLGRLEQLKTNTTSVQETVEEDIKLTRCNEQESTQEFSTEINRLTEEAKTDNDGTEQTRQTPERTELLEQTNEDNNTSTVDNETATAETNENPVENDGTAN
eukprot:gene1775-2441_t